MVEEEFVVRQITDKDRQDYERRAVEARADGDEKSATFWEKFIQDWEAEQGTTKLRLCCSVCGRSAVAATSRGTAYRHARDSPPLASWDRVARLRAQIKTLQEELDRVLDAIENESATRNESE